MLEEQLNGLTGPIFRLLMTPEPGMVPHLQDVISGAESEACSILCEHGRLTSRPQVSHTLSEVIRRVQIAQCTLTHMRGFTEHTSTHQDGGAPPRAEELLESDDSENKGDVKETTITLDSDDGPENYPGLYKVEREDPRLAPSTGRHRHQHAGGQEIHRRQGP